MGRKYAVTARRLNNTGATAPKLALYLAFGLAVGILLGYTLMGTAHAILETRGNQHFTNNAETRGATDASEASTVGGGGGAVGGAIHILATSNGSPYQNYQMRIAYATYTLIQKMPGGDRHVGFTRILHRSTDDVLTGEIPTFRADPLQPKCDDWCEYPVSDRANAMSQFFAATAADPSMLKADWLYMIESDYVFMKPLDLPPQGARTGAWAFPFAYINPRAQPEQLMRKLFPEAAGPVSAIPNSGPAPLLMRRSDWKRVTPDWERLTAVIEGDEEMRKKLGWVREMYAFSAALALHRIEVDLTPAGENRFIVQLPGDSSLGIAHAFHYTQCTIYKTMDGGDAWGYDKRFFTTPEVVTHTPLVEMPPEWEDRKYKFVEGDPVTREKNETIVQMLEQMNRGIATLHDLPGRAKGPECITSGIEGFTSGCKT